MPKNTGSLSSDRPLSLDSKSQALRLCRNRLLYFCYVAAPTRREDPYSELHRTDMLEQLTQWRASVLAGLGVTLTVLLVPAWAAAKSVAVSYAEGAAHGYLGVQDGSGESIAHGELLQTVRGNLVESRLVFRFKDGSLFDERTTFSQRRVFRLQKYRLIQRGPSFPEELDIRMDRKSGRYRVRSRAGADQSASVTAGRLAIPSDAYNGLIGTLLKNLPARKGATVKIVAFTPEPELITLDLRPEAKERVQVGDLLKTATRWVLEPRIHGVVHFFGKVLGQLPDEFRYRYWIIHDRIPTFARFEGPLHLMGPVWRVQVLSPRLAASPPAKPES